MSLQLDMFRQINDARAVECFGHPQEGPDAWTPAEWGCALAGEVGELCNLLKKRRRGELISIKQVADEIADVFTYLDIVASVHGIDLSDAVVSKWNDVSSRRHWPVRIAPEGNATYHRSEDGGMHPRGK